MSTADCQRVIIQRGPQHLPFRKAIPLRYPLDNLNEGRSLESVRLRAARRSRRRLTSAAVGRNVLDKRVGGGSLCSGCLEKLHDVARRILDESLAATIALDDTGTECTTGRLSGGDGHVEVPQVELEAAPPAWMRMVVDFPAPLRPR